MAEKDLIFRSLWGKLLILFLLGRLSLVLVTVSFPDGGVLVDSEGYLHLARTIEKQKTFVDADGGDLYWPPGYPLVLIVARLAAGRENTPVAVSFMQLALSGLTCVALYRAGRQMGSQAGGLVAAWLMAISPHSALWSLAVMSEILFAFLLVVSFTLWLSGASQGRWLPAAACGAVLGFAALVRPIGLALIPLWAILGGASLWQVDQRRQALRVGAAMVVAGALVAGTWVGRNWFERGYLGFSRLSSRTFYSFNLAPIVAEKEGISRDEAAVLIGNQGDLTGFTRDFIREEPVLFAAGQVRGIIRSMIGDESSAWARFFGVEGVEGYGILTALLGGDAGRIVTENKASGSGEPIPFLLPARIYGFLYTMGIYVLAFIGVFVRPRGELSGKRNTLSVLLIGLTAAYLLVAPAGAGQARFRIPAEPLLALLAGIGAVRLVTGTSIGRTRTFRGNRPGGIPTNREREERADAGLDAGSSQGIVLLSRKGMANRPDKGDQPMPAAGWREQVKAFDGFLASLGLRRPACGLRLAGWAAWS